MLDLFYMSLDELLADCMQCGYRWDEVKDEYEAVEQENGAVGYLAKSVGSLGE